MRDKFIINSAFIWQGINSNDYEDFVEIQKIRNDISHGQFDMQSSLPVRKVEVLVSKLVENYHNIIPNLVNKSVFLPSPHHPAYETVQNASPPKPSIIINKLVHFLLT